MSSIRCVLLLFLLLFVCQTSTVSGFVEGFYCDLDNCYDLLGVTNTASKNEIRKAYRSLSLEYHPDKNPGNATAAEHFRKIATAYEILKDDGQREDYDYMLANPNEHYLTYWRYYKRKSAAKVDASLVIISTIVLVSIIQYLSLSSRYWESLKFMSRNPKVKAKLLRLVEDKGLSDQHRALRKAKNLEGEEKLLIHLLETECKHTCLKPVWHDTFGFTILKLPYYLVAYLYWYASWVYRFHYKKEEYGPAEKEYLTRKNAGISKVTWSTFEDWEKEELIQKELWVPENLETHMQEIQEQEMEKVRDSSQYKRMKRWLKHAEPSPL